MEPLIYPSTQRGKLETRFPFGRNQSLDVIYAHAESGHSAPGFMNLGG